MYSICEKYKGEEPRNIRSINSKPVAYPGLTLLSGKSGSLKSYTSIKLSKGYDYVFHLDFGLNPLQFKDFCMKNDVKYLNVFNENVLYILYDLIPRFKDKKALFIVDYYSLSENIVSKLRKLAIKNNVAIMIIDTNSYDFREIYADIVIHTEHIDYKNYECIVKVDKSKVSNIAYGDEFKE